MDDKKMERDIYKTLKGHTDDVVNEKEEIWNYIESQINLQENKLIPTTKKKEEKKVKQRKKSTRRLFGLVVAAAIVVLVFGMFTTNTGQAFVEQIKQYFVPEKEVITEIEGDQEQSEVILQERVDYIIYIDEERYQLVQEGGVDKIVPKVPLEDKYPEVSMTISQIVDKTPEQLANEYADQLKSSFETVKEIESVTEPVNGLLVSAIDGNEWDSKVNKLYIISNGREGSFVFDLKYFLEASEGHGARFYHMLKEFQIVEE
ncbi:hypothetical protein SFC08_17990 [Lysinibacillus halotolerans]|uniref:DUF4367 domain-containing protein n=1 Tax=Lysinibacillus halotolerans TaxID=1368476 RepID=A0A3M8HAA4_9BACI|nr:hypothetical protein [Lysinibacillus halotolerans]RNC99321.1 hypothetical protein EC501_08250 [Lysinibacillus halotolerans]